MLENNIKMKAIIKEFILQVDGCELDDAQRSIVKKAKKFMYSLDLSRAHLVIENKHQYTKIEVQKAQQIIDNN